VAADAGEREQYSCRPVHCAHRIPKAAAFIFISMCIENLKKRAAGK
jgi:hypothetical protein